MRASIIHGAVLAALTATGVAWVGSDKSVTVEIDGQSQVVVTHASTVAEVLDRAGVALDPHDEIAPAGSMAVKNGTHIVIRRGRLVTVRVNDVERGVWVNAMDVDQVLAEIGIAADDRTYVSASRSSRVPSTGMFALQVRMPSAVRLKTEQSDRTVITTEPTVADLLAAEGVTLTPNDEVLPALGSYPAEGTTVVVRDVRGVRVSRTRPIPFKVRSTVDPNLPVGVTRVRAPGVRGVLVLYFRELSTNGGPAVRTPDGSRIARPPRDRIVIVGGRKPAVLPAKAPVVRVTPKPPPIKAPVPKPVVRKVAVPPKTGPSHPPLPDKLNWAALAACESGNNPRAVSPGGTYRGLYQFMLATWHGVGGVGDPINASRNEQTYRAQLLYRRVGARAWGSCGSRLFR